MKEVRQETQDCVSIAFDIPAELKELFDYKPGQYINLIKTLDGQELHRSYSLCSSPDESCLLYTSDAADERSSVDLVGCRIIKKKK